MKIQPFTIPKPQNEALIFQIDEGTEFYDKFHEHEDFQLSFIKKGRGTVIVGNTITEFKEGQLFFLGSHLAHVFKADSNPNNTITMYSLFFKMDSFGKGLFDLKEFEEFQPFFRSLANGIQPITNLDRFNTLFNRLPNANSFNRFKTLLEIIELSGNSNCLPLSVLNNKTQYSDNTGHRMRAIFDYTFNHYTEKITLDDIAEISFMTKNAFCKYFKQRTNKTYSQFLNELRIEHACKLLRTDKDTSITEIALMSGYNNTSHFNRQFKYIKQVTPLAFKGEVYS
ncbi:MAG: AraC family transcriptional regulator [Bacteroidetes bacterium MedPE-SWsnd-G2]|nr:MAG: AraC family transcriptional regulator [Bacteroidetes bacterium MedPE-SWsnd-G2]